MSSVSLRAVPSPLGDDATPGDEVRELMEALETFAFQSERVLARLDLRAAAQARHVARQLSTIMPFVQLGLDDEQREAASLELAELVAQARNCLGASFDPRRLEQVEPGSSVRARRDLRRDPTQDAAPAALVPPCSRPATPVTRRPGDDERHRLPTESEASAESVMRGRATEPEGVDAGAPSVPLDSGVRRAGRSEADDAAACQQWKSLLSGGTPSVRALESSRSVLTLTEGRRRDPR